MVCVLGQVIVWSSELLQSHMGNHLHFSTELGLEEKFFGGKWGKLEKIESERQGQRVTVHMQIFIKSNELILITDSEQIVFKEFNMTNLNLHLDYIDYI